LTRHCLFTRWKYTMKNLRVKRILTAKHGVLLIITRQNMGCFLMRLIFILEVETWGMVAS
ncbi:MAG: hypothetical protein ACXU9J_01780, partial [Syntrophales bacterium]